MVSSLAPISLINSALLDQQGFLEICAVDTWNFAISLTHMKAAVL